MEASGTIAGQQVRTTVDGELARYYLEHYVAGEVTDAEHHAQLRDALSQLDGQPLNVERLQRLTARFSTDLAALYFVQRLYGDPMNRRAQDAFHERLRSLRARPASGSFRVPEETRSHLVAFVPGYAYRKDTTTGADFARQREVMERAGFRTVLIETDELGTVEDNAAIVADAIRRLGAEHEGILLVSASKAGPEVAMALGRLLRPEETRGLPAWISIGGILRGSPYADRFLRWPWTWYARTVFFFKGLDGSVIPSLSAEVRRPAFEQLRLPQDLPTLQYVGVPLSGQVGRSVRGRYSALRPLGPNDGLTLLADQLVPGGVVITDLGLDHYYRDPDIDLKTLALAHVVLSDLFQDRRRPGS